MSRSKWKGPFVDFQHLNNNLTYFKQQENNIKTNIKISRNSDIIPGFLGLTFYVYNGKSYDEIIVNEDMIGHKFGEFSFTRAKFIFKKKNKKK
jgi:small subunit ribosomal protein S19